MEVFRSEIKTGLLILVAAILLAVGIFMVGDIKRRFLEEQKEIVLLFPHANGINKGSPVWYAGLEVGEVSKVAIARDKGDRIAVTVSIDPEARVRRDSKAYIRNLGLMGAKYVEITPGSAAGEEIGPGEILEGEAPTSIAQIMETIQRSALQLSGTIEAFQALIQDIRGNVPIEQTIRNANALLGEMRQMGRDLGALFHRMDDLLGETQGSIERLSGTLNDTSQSLNQTVRQGGEEIVALLRELRQTNRALQQQLTRLEGQLTPVLGQAHHDLTEAGDLLEDVRSVLDENDLNIYTLILHLKETSRHLEALSEDLRAHPWKILWKGEGTYDEGEQGNPADWRSKARIGPYGRE